MKKLSTCLFFLMAYVFHGECACTGTAPTVSIAATTPASNTVCVGATIKYTATPTAQGGTTPTYQWQVNGSNVGTSATTYTYTPVAGDVVTCIYKNTCNPSSPATSNSLFPTVNPIPVLTSATTVAACSGTALNYTIANNTAGTSTYKWSRAAVTGISNAAATNQTANPITEALTNTYENPITPVYKITVTSASNCSVTASVSVTVNPAIGSIASQTFCNGSSTSAISMYGTSWTNDNTSIGLAASGSGDIASFTATNSGSSPATATISYTQGCSTPLTNSFTITVNPTATVNTIHDTTVCTGAGIPGYTVSSPQPNPLFTWTNDNTSIGLAASGTGNIPSFTTTNAGSSPITAHITITPTTSGYAYMTDALNGVAYSISRATNKLVATIPGVGGFFDGYGISLSSDGKWAYVANNESGTVSVISTVTGSVTSTVTVGANPCGLVVTPDGKFVYVANSGDGTISVISTASNTVVKTINLPVAANPTGIAISPDGSRVYVTKTIATGKVYFIKTSNNTVFDSVTVGYNPSGIVVSPDGSKVYVASYGAATAAHYIVSAITVGTKAVTTGGTYTSTVNTQVETNGLALSPDGLTLYVTSFWDGTVVYYNTASLAAKAGTITLPGGSGEGPVGVSVSADGSFVYASNTGDGYYAGNHSSLDIINATTKSVIAVDTLNNSMGEEISFSFGNFSTGVTCPGTPLTFSITVSPILTPSVSIAITNGSQNTCTGSSVTFTATPTNGGVSPDYNFKVNGTSVQDGTSSTFTTTSLANGDIVTCVMTPVACSSPASATSSGITMTVNTTPVASASNDGPYVSGQTINLSASGGSSYSWSSTTGYTSGSQNPSISNADVTMTGDYTVTVTSGTCSSTASTHVVVTAPTSFTWTAGANTTDWFTPGNWDNGIVPNNCSASVTIPAGTSKSPTISGAGASVGNITIDSAAVLTLSAQNLNVCGNFTGGTGSAATVAGSGKMILTGGNATVQTISGISSLQTLELNNALGAGLQSGAQVDIYNSIILTDGSLDVPSDASLTFKSTSTTQSAILDDFTSRNAGKITGKITAERYYGNAILFGQHMLGSPVSGITMAALGSNSASGAYIQPTANCDELHSANGTPYGNVFSNHESNGSSCTMATWYVESAAAATVAGQGYSVVLTHPNTAFSVTGTPNENDNYTLNALGNSNWSNTTLQGRPYLSGWSLLSNPYLAPLDATGLITDNATGFDEGILVWNQTTGSYQSVTTIAPFQAFMVHRSWPLTGSGNYIIDGSHRVTTGGTFQKRQKPSELNITLTNTTTGLDDAITVGFNTHATNTFDSKYDFIKFPNDLNRHTLYTLNDGKWMMRNILFSIKQTSTVDVGFEPGVSGTYSFTFDGINSFDPTSYITLEDRKLNTIHDLRSGNYTFTADTKDDWNRFILHFTPAATVQSYDATCNSMGAIHITQPGIAEWAYVLSDNNRTTIAMGKLNAANELNVSLNPGTYSLALTDANGYIVVKNIQVNGVEPVVANFTASATTTEVNQEITLNANSTHVVDYNWDFGDGATGTGTTSSHSYSTEGVYTIQLSAIGETGCTSTTSKTVTITSRSITGISGITANEKINIWSSDNRVFIDFTQQKNVNAQVDIYNVLGQQLSSEKFGNSNIYQKQITNLDAAYLIIKVQNNDKLVTKKVFIENTK